MKTYTKTVTETKPRLVIEREKCPVSPREDDNLGYFITIERNYNSPDKNEIIEDIITETGAIADDQDEHIKAIKREIKEQTDETVLEIYPVSKYEHSGVVYSLGTSQGFDYSSNGFYIVTKKRAEIIGTEPKDFEKVITAEIEMYNSYINGEVYRFTLFNKDGEEEDTCSGYYDIEDIREYLPEEFKGEDLSEYLIND